MACKRVVVSLFDNGQRIAIEAMDRKDQGGTVRHCHTGRSVMVDAKTVGQRGIAKSDGLTVLVPEGDLYEKVAAILPQLFATCRNVSTCKICEHAPDEPRQVPCRAPGCKGGKTHDDYDCNECAGTGFVACPEC